MSLIDIFNHVMPSAYLEALKQHSRDPGIVRRMTSLRMLWDIEARVEMLKQWPDLKQVLTLAVPSPELLSGPELSPELARLANVQAFGAFLRWDCINAGQRKKTEN